MDWSNPQIYTMIVSALALIVSIAPHAWRVLRPGRLGVEPYTYIALGTHFGLPRVTLHLTLTNRGGRRVRIKKVTIALRRDGDEPFELPGIGYFEKFNDPSAVLLTPFVLKGDDTWSHAVNFQNPLTREEDRTIRQLSSALSLDIVAKRRHLPSDAPPVAGDEPSWKPLVEFFNGHFRWKEGEYRVRVRVDLDSRAKVERFYRLAVFESDARDLSAATEDYRFGWGVFLDPNKQRRLAILAPLSEAPAE